MDERNSTRIIRRLYISLLPVQAMAAGLPALNGLLDSIIVGNFFGPGALAAIGFAGPLNMCLTAVSSMLATGSQLICGHDLGKGDGKGICATFSSTMASCLVFGLLLSLACLFFPMQIAAALGSSGESLAMTAGYIRGMSVGYVFSVLLASLLPFLQLDQAGKISTLSVGTMVGVNLTTSLLNAMVIHGGMVGVGMTTALANIAAVAVALPHFLGKSKSFRFDFKLIRLDSILKICYQGLPTAIAPVCLMVRDRVINSFVFALGGTIGMSAMTIANNINCAFGGVVEAGYSGSSRLIASVLVGERDSSSLRDLSRVMVRVGAPIYAAAYAVVFVLAKPLALLFGADPAHIGTYVMVVRLFNLWYLTNILKSPPLCVYQAMGEVKLISLLQILNNMLFPVGACLLLGNVLGLPLVVSTSWIPEILLIITMAIIFTVRVKRLPRRLTELVDVPSTLSAPRANRFKATISTVEEAVKASEAAAEFCRSRGMSSKDAFYCGLCIEEMAVDTIRNRFHNDGCTIDLRMIFENDGLKLILRDDCNHFDPNEWLELCTPEDSSRSIGIRMVTKLAKQMTYSSALGLNVLTILL